MMVPRKRPHLRAEQPSTKAVPRRAATTARFFRRTCHREHVDAAQLRVRQSAQTPQDGKDHSRQQREAIIRGPGQRALCLDHPP